MWAAGMYESPIPFKTLGDLVESDPDGASDIIPGLTNLQAALFMNCATFQLWPFNSWWHYMGGEFDEESGLPTALRFTSIPTMADFMQTGCPYESLRLILDYEMVMCGGYDVPWDDHYAVIKVPILCLAPAGWMGKTAYYTLGLLGSTNKQIIAPSLLGPEQRVEDFGHIDLWTALQAPELVWQPLLEWIEAHTPGGGHRIAEVREVDQ